MKTSRNTQQRKLIKEVFAREGRPLGTQEVLELTRDDLPGLGIATVYRTVRKLMDDGELIALEIPGSGTLFELTPEHHHHHFQCTACRRVYELSVCNADLSSMIPRGFTLEDHEIILRGRCASCVKVPADKPGA